MSFILGVTAGLIIVLTGILTALKITPGIFAAGLEVPLGIWRIFAGTLIIIFAFISKKQIPMNWIIIVFGVFEVLVFFVEKDYTILTAGPFLAILAGILGLVKR